MEDSIDATRSILHQPVEEVVLIQIIGDTRVANIAELGTITEVVDNNDVIAPPLVQAMNEVAAYESRAARDNNQVTTPTAVLLMRSSVTLR